MAANEFLAPLLAALASGSFLAAVLGLIFHRRVKALEAALTERLQQNIEVFRTTRAWKEAVISDLLGPLMMQLDRTRRAALRYAAKNVYLEAKVLADANANMRSLLLAKGHLIPPELFEDAGRLVEHFEVWLEEFARARGEDAPDSATEFVFAGPKGFPFPRTSETNFREAFHNLRKEIYGVIPATRT